LVDRHAESCETVKTGGEIPEIVNIAAYDRNVMPLVIQSLNKTLPDLPAADDDYIHK
jgi:hypothetical protein